MVSSLIVVLPRIGNTGDVIPVADPFFVEADEAGAERDEVMIQSAQTTLDFT